MHETLRINRAIRRLEYSEALFLKLFACEQRIRRDPSKGFNANPGQAVSKQRALIFPIYLVWSWGHNLTF